MKSRSRTISISESDEAMLVAIWNHAPFIPRHRLLEVAVGIGLRVMASKASRLVAEAQLSQLSSRGA